MHSQQPTLTMHGGHASRRRPIASILLILLVVQRAAAFDRTQPAGRSVQCTIDAYRDDGAVDPADTATATADDVPEPAASDRIALHCANTTLAAINADTALTTLSYTAIRFERVASPAAELFATDAGHLLELSWTHSDLRSDQLDALLQRNFTRLRVLNVRSNRIDALDARRFVDHLSADTLHQLDLSDNLLATIVGPQAGHVGLFARQTALQSLRLAANRIDDLPRTAFDGLQRLRRLDLAHNRLVVVPFQVFRPLAAVEWLDLSHNQLMSFLDNYFVPNGRLRELRLNANRLERLTKHSLHGLHELQHLDLSDNQLISVDRNAFDSLEALRYLNLSGNRFDGVSSALFGSLRQLRSLDLSHNVFRQLPNGVLAGCSALRELRICGTALQRLGNWVSRHNGTVNAGALAALRIVRIEDNAALTDIEPCTFASTLALEELYLAGNALRALPKELGELSALRVLDVSRNALHALPWQLGGLTALRRLSIDSNDFYCDCRMYWLVGWLDEVQRQPADTDTDTGDLLQSELGRLKCRHGYPGDMLQVLQQLHCTRPQQLHTTAPQMYRLRSSAVLQCSFSGNPAPDLIWVTPTNQILRYYADPDAKPVLLDAGDDEPRITRDRAEFQQLIGSSAALAANTTLAVAKAVGVSLLDNGALEVHSISRKDSGVYTCYGYNLLGNATADIR